MILNFWPKGMKYVKVSRLSMKQRTKEVTTRALMLLTADRIKFSFFWPQGDRLFHLQQMHESFVTYLWSNLKYYVLNA